jgi:hypothetical protein
MLLPPACSSPLITEDLPGMLRNWCFTHSIPGIAALGLVKLYETPPEASFVTQIWVILFSQPGGLPCLVVFLAFSLIGFHHKVRTYKEYHSVCPSSELGLSQPLFRQRVFTSPQKQGGGGTLACGWGVGGSPNSDEGRTQWYSLYVRTLWISLFLT